MKDCTNSLQFFIEEHVSENILHIFLTQFCCSLVNLCVPLLLKNSASPKGYFYTFTDFLVNVPFTFTDYCCHVPPLLRCSAAIKLKMTSFEKRHNFFYLNIWYVCEFWKHCVLNILYKTIYYSNIVIKFGFIRFANHSILFFSTFYVRAQLDQNWSCKSWLYSAAGIQMLSLQPKTPNGWREEQLWSDPMSSGLFNRCFIEQGSPRAWVTVGTAAWCFHQLCCPLKIYYSSLQTPSLSLAPLQGWKGPSKNYQCVAVRWSKVPYMNSMSFCF